MEIGTIVKLLLLVCTIFVAIDFARLYSAIQLRRSVRLASEDYKQFSIFMRDRGFPRPSDNGQLLKIGVRLLFGISVIVGAVLYLPK